MSSAGLGQGQLGMEGQGLLAQGRCGVLLRSWALWKAPITPAGYYQGLWQHFGICPTSRIWPCNSWYTFFPLQDLKHCFHSSADLVPP